MALTTTREYRWDDAGAPVLNGLAGSFYALAKACFVGTGGVAYGTGADEKPAAGWSLPWDDPVGFKAVFRNSLAHGGSGCYVRVLDDGSSAGGPRVARIDVYESMTDIDTGANHVAGGWMWKARLANAEPRSWTAHADERTVYITTYVGEGEPPVVAGAAGAYLVGMIGAGDYAPTIAGDPAIFGSLMETESPATGPSAAAASVLGRAPSPSNPVGTSSAFRVARDTLLAPSPPQATLIGGSSRNGGPSVGYGGQSSLLPWPSPGTDGGHMIPGLVYADGALRGRMRGLYIPLNDWVSDGGAVVGGVQVPLATAQSLSLAVLAGNSTTVGAINAFQRLFVERLLSWDAV